MAKVDNCSLPSKGWSLVNKIKTNFVLVLITVLIVLLILIPFVRLILSSFQLGHPAMPQGWTIKNYLSAYSLPIFYQALGNTISISSVSTIVTLAIATLFAWMIERTDMPYRNLAWILILIPMAIPGVLFALSWVLLLAPKTGAINLLLRNILEPAGIHLTQGPFNIYSLGGLIFITGLRGVTTIFLMIVGAFRLMDPSLEEAARVSGASGAGTFFRVTLPILMPAIFMAAIFEFVVCMESFEAPLAVGLPAGIYVLSTLIYFTVQLRAPINYGLGSVFGVTYMLFLLLLLLIYRRAVGYSENYATVTGKGYRPRVISIGKWRYLAFALFALYFLLTVAAPFAILFWASLMKSYHVPSFEALKFASFANYREIFSTPYILKVAWNTVIVMGVTATITMIVAFLVSWIVVRVKMHGSALLDIIVFLPRSIPGIVIALAIIMTCLSPPMRYLGIYGTLWVTILALVVSNIAFGTRLMNSAIVQINKELEESAFVSGATYLKTLFAVTLPLLFPSFVSGWVWVAIHSFRAFSIPIMLSSKQNEVLAILMWHYWTEGSVSLLATLGVILTIILIPLTLVLRRSVVRMTRQD